MKRRDFMGWVSVGTLAGSLPVVLAACNSETDTASTPSEAESAATEAPSTEATGEAGEFTAIGTVADLEANGSLVDKAFAAGPVVAIRDPANADEIIALDPRCPHQGCAVDWQADEAMFTCPCHGSKFGPDGVVQVGPAASDLPSYSAKIEGDQVLVSAN